MAFNPFNIFRRNQKTIFAVITVFIMFTFVLSSGMGGGNDFFDWFPQWFGSKTKGRGEHLCTIGNTRVYSRDVQQTQLQRLMAIRFMKLAYNQALQNLEHSLSDLQAKATPQLVGQLLAARQRPQQLPSLIRMLRSAPMNSESDKQYLDTWQAVIDLGSSPVSDGLVAWIPNKSDRDVIEYMLWEKKAEQLGIQFTEEDLTQLIKREVRQPVDDRPIRQALKDMKGFSWKACEKALMTEFRVRAARDLLLGPVADRSDRTLTASPVVPTAYDLFSFYREQTSPTTYQVLAVPVANFAEGMGIPDPTESEAKRLFDERKDAEPDPSKEQPGFREPRKIKVGWLGVSGAEPHYRKQAEADVARRPMPASLVPRLLIAPIASPWAPVTAAPIIGTDPILQQEETFQQEYKKAVEHHKLNVSQRWSGVTTFVIPDDLLATSLVQARPLAAAVAGGVGFGGGLRAASNLYGYTVLAEQKARVKSGLPFVLGPIPGPGMFPTMIGGVAAFEAAKPAPLSFETVRPEYLQSLVEMKSRELAALDLDTLKKAILEATDGGRAKDKSRAAAAIAEFIKTRGLDDKSTDPEIRRAGESKALASEWTIADDEGLAPLKKVLDKSSGANPHGNMPIAFGQKFFYTDARGKRELATGTYNPESYPERQATSPLNKGEPMFLVWRTQEEPAHSVTFEEAKPKVAAAWKRNKARALAKAEAESLATKIHDYQRPGIADFYPYLLDLQAQLQNKAKGLGLKAQERVKLFRVENVAPAEISMFGAQPFQLKPTVDIPYPTREMTTMLIAERTKPEKTSFVLADQPKDIYYVFIVAGRREKQADEFKQTVYGEPPQPPELARFGFPTSRQVMNMAYSRDATTKAHDSVLGMLKKEFDYKETEAQKKLLDDKDAKSSSSAEE